MQSQDLEVLSRLAHWLRAGHTCHLCTIVETYGSSPRPVGSLLALSEDGGLVGSLSGGCVEDDLVEALRRGELVEDGPRMLQYGLDASDTERLGLPCGGTLAVVVERLVGDAENVRLHDAIVERLEARRSVARSVELRNGARAIVTDVDAPATLSLTTSNEGIDVLRQVYGPRRQLFLIGAGMVSRYLAEMAQALEFEVTVCDPRQEMLDQWHVAGVDTICAMPDDAIRARANDARTAIIALTHDPRIDDMGLLEALETDAFYIGAMGSRLTSEKRRARLRELDVDAAALARMHAPVGLAIGSKTPAEIAIAILAELTLELSRARAIARASEAAA